LDIKEILLMILLF